MTKTIIIMNNNYCGDCVTIAELSGIHKSTIRAIHCEYYPERNETHIIITHGD